MLVGDGAHSVLTSHSYAKVNLFLEVGNRRDDGFHNIETIFQTVDLADELRFEARENDVVLDCDRDDLDTGPANLVHRAAEVLRDDTGCAAGARITLTKRIPIAAGLAGGSGNAAATLIGLNRLWGLELPPERLHALALRLGSDVPYCLRGGTVGGRGRGELMAPLAPLRDVWFVMVHPAIQVSTAWVYGHPDLPRRPMDDTPTRPFRDALDALAKRDWPRVLKNAMETVVFDRHPELAAIKHRLIDAGCTAAVMSGSGPTVFGVTESENAAQRAAKRIAESPVTVTRPVDHGVT